MIVVQYLHKTMEQGLHKVKMTKILYSLVCICYLSAKAAEDPLSNVAFTNTVVAGGKIIYASPSPSKQTWGVAPSTLSRALTNPAISGIRLVDDNYVNILVTNVSSNAVATMKGQFNVELYGAKHDGIEVTGSMSSNSVFFTNSLGGMTGNDVGKIIEVARAGLNGQSMWGTITNLVNSSVVAVSFRCSNTVVGVNAAYGHNDQAAITLAERAVESFGGGTLLFPGGSRYFIVNTFMLQTNTWGAYGYTPAIDIRTNNIIWQGIGSPILHFVGGYRLLNGLVVRSGGIQLGGYAGLPSYLGLCVTNISFHDLQIYGGKRDAYTGLSGYQYFPADIADGTGWDTGHKGITTWYSSANIHYINCDISGWTAEAIYYGSEVAPGLYVDRCRLYNNNASSINPSDTVIVQNSVVHDSRLVAEVGRFGFTGQSLFNGCTFSNVLNGVSVTGSRMTNGGVLTPGVNSLTFDNNQWTDVDGNCFIIGNCRQVTISNQKFINVGGTRINISGAAIQGDYPYANNLSVLNNIDTPTNLSSVFISMNGNIINSKFENNYSESASPILYGGYCSNNIVLNNTFPNGFPYVSGTLLGWRPLEFNGHYGFGNQFIPFASASLGNPVIVQQYISESVELTVNNGLQDVYLITNNIPDGFEVELHAGQFASPGGLTLSAFRVLTASNQVVGTTRYIRGFDDKLKFRYNLQTKLWYEISWHPGLAHYASTAPASGNYWAGEEILSLTTNQYSFICLVGSTNNTGGIWATNYIYPNNALMRDGSMAGVITNGPLNISGLFPLAVLESSDTTNTADQHEVIINYMINNTPYTRRMSLGVLFKYFHDAVVPWGGNSTNAAPSYTTNSISSVELFASASVKEINGTNGFKHYQTNRLSGVTTLVYTNSAVGSISQTLISGEVSGGTDRNISIIIPPGDLLRVDGGSLATTATVVATNGIEWELNCNKQLFLNTNIWSFKTVWAPK